MLQILSAELTAANCNHPTPVMEPETMSTNALHYHIAKGPKGWRLERVEGGELRHRLIATYGTKAQAVTAGRVLAGWRGRVTTKASEL